MKEKEPSCVEILTNLFKEALTIHAAKGISKVIKDCSSELTIFMFSTTVTVCLRGTLSCEIGKLVCIEVLFVQDSVQSLGCYKLKSLPIQEVIEIVLYEAVS